MVTHLRSFRLPAAVAGAALLASSFGCSITSEFFNPEFLSTLGAGSTVAVFPGNAPAIRLEVENRTRNVIEANLAFRDANDEVRVRPIVVDVGDTYAEAIICPMSEVTLGTLNQATSVGAYIRLGGGTQADPLIQVDPFGTTLLADVNYSCGDIVTFTVQPSSAASSGYQIFAYIRTP